MVVCQTEGCVSTSGMLRNLLLPIVMIIKAQPADGRKWRMHWRRNQSTTIGKSRPSQIEDILNQSTLFQRNH